MDEARYGGEIESEAEREKGKTHNFSYPHQCYLSYSLFSWRLPMKVWLGPGG